MTATLEAHPAHRVRFLPTTRLGRLAARLGLGFVAWFVLNQTLVVSDLAPEGAWRIGVIVFGLSGLALGLVTGIVAILAIVRQHERAILAFLLALPAVMVVTFVLGEIFLPH